MALDEALNRFLRPPNLDATRVKLEAMTKSEIVDWIMKQPGVQISNSDLLRLLDLAAKYGIGKKLAAQEAHESITFNVIGVPLRAEAGANLNHLATGSETCPEAL